MAFDIKFTRQGFENDCLYREACRDIGILGEWLLISSLPGKEYIGILGEWLLISSLQGKALRTIVYIARLAEI